MKSRSSHAPESRWAFGKSVKRPLKSARSPFQSTYLPRPCSDNRLYVLWVNTRPSQSTTVTGFPAFLRQSLPRTSLFCRDNDPCLTVLWSFNLHKYTVQYGSYCECLDLSYWVNPRRTKWYSLKCGGTHFLQFIDNTNPSVLSLPEDCSLSPQEQATSSATCMSAWSRTSSQPQCPLTWRVSSTSRCLRSQLSLRRNWALTPLALTSLPMLRPPPPHPLALALLLLPRRTGLFSLRRMNTTRMHEGYGIKNICQTQRIETNNGLITCVHRLHHSKALMILSCWSYLQSPALPLVLSMP